MQKLLRERPYFNRIARLMIDISCDPFKVRKIIPVVAAILHNETDSVIFDKVESALKTPIGTGLAKFESFYKSECLKLKLPVTGQSLLKMEKKGKSLTQLDLHLLAY